MKIIQKLLLIVLAFSALNLSSTNAIAQEPFLGEIRFVAFNFAPRGWAKCDGQLLPINQNQALFSILGTTYGGDGRTTFALPDMRGRTPVHEGNGPGLSNYILGEKRGEESVSLNTSQMANHTHSLNASSLSARTDEAADNSLARTRSNLKAYDDSVPNVKLSNDSVGAVGSNIPVNYMQPSTVLNCTIALVGSFPSRN